MVQSGFLRGEIRLKKQAEFPKEFCLSVLYGETAGNPEKIHACLCFSDRKDSGAAAGFGFVQSRNRSLKVFALFFVSGKK